MGLWFPCWATENRTRAGIFWPGIRRAWAWRHIRPPEHKSSTAFCSDIWLLTTSTAAGIRIFQSLRREATGTSAPFTAADDDGATAETEPDAGTGCGAAT